MSSWIQTSMLPGNSGTSWLEVLPSLRASCANVRGLLVGDRGPKASVWPDCGVGVGRPEHARQVRMTVGLIRYGDFSHSFRKIQVGYRQVES